MWATGINLARQKAQSNRDFTEGKKALSVDEVVQMVKERKIGDYEFEDATAFFGAKTVYDTAKKVAVKLDTALARDKWSYQPADIHVYEDVERDEARNLSKLTPLRALFSYHPWSENFRMLERIGERDGRTRGAKALERLYELYRE